MCNKIIMNIRINKIHFRYAVTDRLKQQRRPEYRSISQLSDLEPKDRQYYKVKKKFFFKQENFK